MANRWTNKLTHKDVTPEDMYMSRRTLIGTGLAAGVAAGGIGGAAAAVPMVVHV